ncbi:sulfatase-like hydrolase/transferase [Shewanella donghaensis]|uniref:sulfatase-like hydrolase/transferase n=1 Tax=Shewanella donghaensis TaxID=238836 RepID=UPI001182A763|nr:sulfatase-like hydrolase/transferase [Shewanella donghaensis]
MKTNNKTRLHRKLFGALTSIALISTASILPAQNVMAAEAKQPNILLILADDLGYNDVGFNGSTDITTPNLDELANNGTSFSEAYVAHPFCGPSRAALMTGRYPHKIGSQFNLPTKGSDVGVPIDEQFISKLLQNNGYRTGAVGKWHLGEAPEFHPNKRGFDEFYGFTGGGHNYFPEQFKKQYENQVKQGHSSINHYILPLEHNGKDVDENEYITDALSREAVNFVNDSATDDKPFFLYVAYNAPHVPLEAKAEDMAKFPNIKDEKRKTYAGMVYAVDRGVGDIVAALEKTQQLDNTLIVFLSDNGGKLGKGASNYPLKEGKGSVYEGGFRSPMLFHWPEKVASGQRFEHPVLALDLYPTFAALAGVEIPTGKRLDGKDIWSAFSANENPHQDELFYVLRHRKGFSDAAVRRNEWKAVKHGNKPWQLFNVETDLNETKDLSSANRPLLNDMIREMEKWSWDNKQPLWFHEQFEGAEWRLKGMPRFDQTFKTTK